MFQFDKIEYSTSTNDRTKSYNIILNSTQGTGTYNTNKTYNIDWSVIPDQKYKLEFTFFSSKVDTTSMTDLIFVDINFQSNTNCYEATSANTRGAMLLSEKIGCILPTGYNTLSYFYAHNTTNTPCFLDSRPMNKTITVNLESVTGSSYLTLPPYILTLKLTPI